MKKILFVGGDKVIHSYWRNYFGNPFSPYFLEFALTQEEGLMLYGSQAEWNLVAVSSFVPSLKEPIPHYPYGILNTLEMIKNIREKNPALPIFGIGGSTEEIGRKMVEEAGCHCYARGLDAPERIIKYFETADSNQSYQEVTG